jgi:hypothetical protein
MANELQTQSDEAKNIGDEASNDTGFQQMIKFKKGDYWCGEDQIPLGTRYIAHAVGWTKSWVHFENRTVVERRNFRVAKGEKAPEREDIPDRDEAHWPYGLDGKNKTDPWVLQYLLPLEDMNSGDVSIFVGSSFGGRRAVSEVCAAYARRAGKQKTGQPIIELQETTFSSRTYGEVRRPLLRIVGWDGAEGTASERPTPSISEADLKKAEFDDAIPF